MSNENATDLDQTIQLDLTLIGGHRVQVSVHEASPVIHQLLQAYSAGSADPHPVTFGLPAFNKQGTVFIRSSDILAIEIDRIVQPITPFNEQRAGIYVVSRDFLLQETRDALLDYTLVRQPDFRPSTITDKCTGNNVVKTAQRVSEILYDLPPFKHVFVEKLHAALPFICAVLEIKPFPVSRIECQITAHQNGAFFKRHTDDSGGPNTQRRISYVYYFNVEPKAFSGGQLNLYPQNATPITLAPVNNAITFFRSAIEHDVSSIFCQEPGFRHSRFTVNGWIHAQTVT